MVAKSDPQINAKVQLPDQGTDLVIASGGSLVLETGAKLFVGGADLTATAGGVANAVAGAASGIKINASATPLALDGSNPTSFAHGLTTCTAAFVQLVGSAAPGDSTSVLTCVINGANVDVYGWKNTGGTDPTLVASTGTETFNWLVVGT